MELRTELHAQVIRLVRPAMGSAYDVKAAEAWTRLFREINTYLEQYDATGRSADQIAADVERTFARRLAEVYFLTAESQALIPTMMRGGEVDLAQQKYRAMLGEAAPVEDAAMTFAEALIAIGGKEWQSGSKHRIYVNEGMMLDLFGLEVETYKTGSIQSATLNGESISNSKAGKIVAAAKFGKLYLDMADGKIYRSQGLIDALGEDMVREMIATLRERVAEKIAETESK